MYPHLRYFPFLIYFHMTNSKAQEQLFWAIGVIERLANLGFIDNPPMHVTDKFIDLFLSIDEDCKNLFDDEEQFDSLFRYVCKDAGITDPEDVLTVTILARSYRDTRENLVRFALANNSSLNAS